MEYKVNQLAKLSGVSTRTLRFYDEIGLLIPERADMNGYRLYRQEQVDMLQQILFYRELGMPLDEIKQLITAADYDRQISLEHHLSDLNSRREKINVLIENVTKTIQSIKEGTAMTDQEKFEGFKQNLIKENTEKYGDEVTKKYGNDIVEESNKKVVGMTEEQWKKQESLSAAILNLLEKAIKVGDPACKEAQEAADLHRQWLGMFWKDGMYSKQTHLALAEGYVTDSRFTAFYDDKLGNGAAKFFRDAIAVYVK